MNGRGIVGNWIIGASIIAVAGTWSACSGPTTMPSPVGDLIVQPVPQPVQNANPVIVSLTVATTRTEVDRDVDVIADVSDAETPVAGLEFRWTASVGQITGAGPHVTWRLARGAETPVDATVTLDVVERYPDYTATGTPIVSEHHVQRTTEPVRVHDSPAEISRIAVAFLVDYFGHSSVSPSACLVDFADSCHGKEDELSDIEANRATFVILDASARVAEINFDPQMTYADVVAPCTFHDRRLDNGYVGTTDGDCLLTAVYESRRWWLCDSHFRSH